MGFFGSVLGHPVSLGLMQGATTAIRSHREDRERLRNEHRVWQRQLATMGIQDKMARSRATFEQELREKQAALDHERQVERDEAGQQAAQDLENQRQRNALDQIEFRNILDMNEGMADREALIEREKLQIAAKEKALKALNEFEDQKRLLMVKRKGKLTGEDINALIDFGIKKNVPRYYEDKQTTFKSLLDEVNFQMPEPTINPLTGAVEDPGGLDFSATKELEDAALLEAGEKLAARHGASADTTATMRRILRRPLLPIPPPPCRTLWPLPPTPRVSAPAPKSASLPAKHPRR